jgi:hypothetical protein
VTTASPPKDIVTPLVDNHYTGYTIESRNTMAPSWPGWLLMPGPIYVHSDGGRIGPFYWANQSQTTLTEHAFSGGSIRIIRQETYELAGSFELRFQLPAASAQ